MLFKSGLLVLVFIAISVLDVCQSASLGKDNAIRVYKKKKTPQNRYIYGNYDDSMFVPGNKTGKNLVKRFWDDYGDAVFNDTDNTLGKKNLIKRSWDDYGDSVFNNTDNTLGKKNLIKRSWDDYGDSVFNNRNNTLGKKNLVKRWGDYDDAVFNDKKQPKKKNLRNKRTVDDYNDAVFSGSNEKKKNGVPKVELRQLGAQGLQPYDSILSGLKKALGGYDDYGDSVFTTDPYSSNVGARYHDRYNTAYDHFKKYFDRLNNPRYYGNLFQSISANPSLNLALNKYQHDYSRRMKAKRLGEDRYFRDRLFGRIGVPSRRITYSKGFVPSSSVIFDSLLPYQRSKVYYLNA